MALAFCFKYYFKGPSTAHSSLHRASSSTITMDFSRPSSLSGLPRQDEEYLTSQTMSPQPRPVGFFPVTKELFDPLPNNLTCDSAIDLSALNFTAMDPLSFDVSDKLAGIGSKDFFNGPFAIPAGINGFTLPVAEDSPSVSSVRSAVQSRSNY
jgi:hypothetical protein